MGGVGGEGVVGGVSEEEGVLNTQSAIRWWPHQSYHHTCFCDVSIGREPEVSEVFWRRWGT